MSAIVKKFVFSTTSVFNLELGATYMRFYTNGAQVELSGSPYEIVTPWAEADLLELQWAQINDVAYITHPDYPVYKLTRIADTNWTLVPIVFAVPATLDENISTTTITADGYTGTGSNAITLTASAGIFDANHVGSYWRIGYKRELGALTVAIAGDVNSNGYLIEGPYSVRSYGTWACTIILEKKSIDGSTWETVGRWEGASNRNIDVSGESLVATEYRLTIDDFVSASAATVTLEWGDAIYYGTVQITAVGSGTTATADVITDLYTENGWTQSAHPTPYWAEGAWSAHRGYPRAVTLHEQRLVFGGTAHQPSTIWGSAIDDYENFERGVDDDDSYVHTLAGLELNAIQWMGSLSSLFIGTSSSEWRVVGDDYGAVITPTRVNAKQISYYGSEYIQCEHMGTSLVFVERKGNRLRELARSDAGYGTQDLTLLCDHMTEAGYVVQMSFQRDDKLLWCVTSDGRLICFTYNRDQAVLGASQHTTDGLFKSVACIYGDAGAKDEVWAVVQRTVGSSVIYTIEQMDPTPWTTINDAFFVDSGLTYSGSPVNSVTGMDHLAGEDVDVLADGIVYQGITVGVDGSVTLSSGITAAKWQVGLPYEGILSPFRLDADAQLGVHVGKTKRLDSLKVRVRKSRNFSYTFDGGTEFAAKVPEGTQTTAVLGATEAVDISIPIDTTNTTDPQLTIRQGEPVPLTVLALNVGYAVASG
jgi:hypothetical protein